MGRIPKQKPEAVIHGKRLKIVYQPTKFPSALCVDIERHGCFAKNDLRYAINNWRFFGTTKYTECTEGLPSPFGSSIDERGRWVEVLERAMRLLSEYEDLLRERRELEKG